MRLLKSKKTAVGAKPQPPPVEKAALAFRNNSGIGMLYANFFFRMPAKPATPTNIANSIETEPGSGVETTVPVKSNPVGFCVDVVPEPV